MKKLRFDDLADALNATLTGADVEFSGVSTDTRQLQSGDVFLALKGPNFDGHDYVLDAIAAGAVGALVSRVIEGVDCLLVHDTRIALGQMAAFWRQKMDPSVVGITGSNGKTTVKEMVAIIASQALSTLATEGNLNNDIGLPLTLLRIQNESLAVVEMGANHGGEIAYLTNIAQPDIALLNNAGRAHLEGFGSLQAVAEAKAEILQGLKDKGVFIFHHDSPWAELWRQLAGNHSIISFGLSSDADVCSLGDACVVMTDTGFLTQFEVLSHQDSWQVQIPLMGQHNRLNALAAIAVTLQLGVSIEQIQQGLAQLKPVKGRLQLHQTSRANVIDDSYNANPDSVMAAIEVLKGLSGRRFLVLGGLAEMGEQGNVMYQEIGRAAQIVGIEHLYVMSAAQSVLTTFSGDGQAFSTQQALLDTLQLTLKDGDQVLIKGSRSAAMEHIVKALIAEDRC